MNKLKSIWFWLLNPKAWFLALFYLFFICLVASTLTLVIFIPKQTIWHYILYVLSAISLSYFVYTIIIFAPKMKGNIIAVLKKYKFTNTMLTSYGYRTITFGIFSFMLNILYFVFLGVLAIMAKSIWYGSITIYYLVLTLIKGTILYSKKKNGDKEKSQIGCYRYCGIMFILLTIAFSGVIVLIYTSNMYFEYAGIMIYAVAAYTFYKLTLAIYNIFKARKQDDLYIQSIRSINLASALISLIVLQVAMFQAFSPEHNTSIANGLTGGAVSLILFIIGILIIIRANKLKQRREENEK